MMMEDEYQDEEEENGSSKSGDDIFMVAKPSTSTMGIHHGKGNGKIL